MLDTTQWLEVRPGPWDQECNEIEWEAHGLPCLMRRSCLGAWCGYVQIPPSHPWHDLDYAQIEAECHGGLTFSGEKNGVEGHWIGFDCAHYNDLVPGMPADIFEDAVYRDQAYVHAEVEQLAKQVRDKKGAL